MIFNKKNKFCPFCGHKLNDLYKSDLFYNGIMLCIDCKTIVAEHYNFKKGSLDADSGKIGEIINNYYNNIPSSYSRAEWFCMEKKERDFLMFENTYVNDLNKHYILTEQIEMIYSTIINIKPLDNNLVDKCIEICMEDISLASNLRKYWLKSYEGMLPYYPSFYYCVKLYEKTNRFEEAINICKKAIKLGYIRDNSKGGMVSRLARLLNKIGKSEEALKYLDI